MLFSPGPIRNLLEEATACLGELSSPGQACCFKLKPPARLGELGSKLLLYFSYIMALEVEGKGFSPFGNQISLKISKEKKKERENPS